MESPASRLRVRDPMDDNQKRAIKQTFETVAGGYDNHALRFFTAGAAHMADRLPLRGDEEVLDVACGTGHVALAIAQRLPSGRVTAVDFSPGMLARARAKAAAAGITNVELIEGDMQALAYAECFDVAVCAFGIFFVDDMDAELRHIATTVKPGGRIAISNFAEGYMEPLRSRFATRIAGLGVPMPPQTWRRIACEDACRQLFAQVGLRDVTVERQNLGYCLANADEWWNVVWNAGFRRMIASLSAADQARFKREHLAEIEALRTPDGIRMEVPVLLTRGSKPG
jgi:ubiquinone/menaquinone biosynthesis C-methylase UbiE